MHICIQFLIILICFSTTPLLIQSFLLAPMKETISKFISRAALSREPSPIRVISNYLFSLPPSKDVLSLAAGNPAASTFPIDSISVNLKSGKSLKVRV